MKDFSFVEYRDEQLNVVISHLKSITDFNPPENLPTCPFDEFADLLPDTKSVILIEIICLFNIF